MILAMVLHGCFMGTQVSQAVIPSPSVAMVTFICLPLPCCRSPRGSHPYRYFFLPVAILFSRFVREAYLLVAATKVSSLKGAAGVFLSAAAASAIMPRNRGHPCVCMVVCTAIRGSNIARLRPRR